MAIRPKATKRPAAKRVRRLPGEGRRLLLAAAHKVFSEQGYARATTREIAERAGVAEPLLFRNFGSKAALFNEVVFGPLQAFVVDFAQQVDRVGHGYSDAVEGKQFVGQLYDLLEANRGLILSYLAAVAFEPDVLDSGATSVFDSALQVIDRIADHHEDLNAGTFRGREVARRVLERAQIGMVLSAALFGEMLFTHDGTVPTRDKIVDELTRMVVVSLRHAHEPLQSEARPGAVSRSRR
jgi:AcrR family transcriptional regulator